MKMNSLQAHQCTRATSRARKSTGYGLVLAALYIGAAGSALADSGMKKLCGDNSIRGTYGIQMQGTRPSSPGGATEDVIGIVVRNYDGRGHVTQVDNVKGSISGIVPDRLGTGTYEVRDDCTVEIEFQPAPGVVIRELAVMIDNGRELRSITVFPPTIMMSTVQKKL